MNSKTLLFVALCALLLLVTSTIAAETKPEEPKKEVDDVKEPDEYGGGRGCRYGCCGRGPYGRCRRCCRTAEDAEAAEVSSFDTDGDGYGGGGGYPGRGGGGYPGGGYPGRGGGGGYPGRGGHCRYGCCGGYGRYCRCCYNREEAQAVEFGN
ncbi:OLC1v1011271C1 [Oldenlandia corymbosa var. corymbosa]|uniref:OLC1v1011271C1 n=1 Tax=Oldenlandia corymbosa var. corymbosa TaxID=529605 RepID=A0AAV1DTI3_OLDCO|nr:OLC1v1011271C1 [Oldenlandia corymbosa var. corymbosa]